MLGFMVNLDPTRRRFQLLLLLLLLLLLPLLQFNSATYPTPMAR